MKSLLMFFAVFFVLSLNPHESVEIGPPIEG
jgi:hypothetical protein